MSTPSKPHAQVTVVVEKHGVLQDAKAIVTFEVTGCEDCIIKGLRDLLLYQPRFKEIVNKAIRLANETTQKNQN